MVAEVSWTKVDAELLRLENLTEDYRRRFHKPLMAAEIAESWSLVVELRNGLTELVNEWRHVSSKSFDPIVQDLLRQRPRDKKLVMKLLRGIWMGILSRGVGEKKIGQLIEITKRGYSMIAQLEPLGYYSGHFVAQVPKDSSMLQQAQAEHTAIIRELGALRNDVVSKQSQINLLNLYSQTVLANRIHLLTWVLAVLTAGGVIVAALAFSSGK